MSQSIWSLNLSTETLVGLVKSSSLPSFVYIYLWEFCVIFSFFFFNITHELLRRSLVPWGVKAVPRKWQEIQLWIQQRRGSMSLVTSKNWEEKWFVSSSSYVSMAILFLMELILDLNFLKIEITFLVINSVNLYFCHLSCRLCSKLWQYHFPQWPFSLELHLSMVLAFSMQDLQVLSGDG